eukprot:m.88151 g.88151  ORF g.88151 m.88151 type:complete len:847 (+) comp16429_c0_seq8:140-2680(+)
MVSPSTLPSGNGSNATGQDNQNDSSDTTSMSGTLRKRGLFGRKKKDRLSSGTNSGSDLLGNRTSDTSSAGGLRGVLEEPCSGDLVYRVVVQNADSVMAADKGISSDVFCKLKFATSKKWLKTETVWKTLNPIWGAEFILNAPSNDKVPPTLEFQLFDEDGLMTSDDYLGGAVLVLNPHQTDPKLVKWNTEDPDPNFPTMTKASIKLQNLKNDKDLIKMAKFHNNDIGTLHVWIQQLPSDSLDVAVDKEKVMKNSLLVMVTPISGISLRPTTLKSAQKGILSYVEMRVGQMKRKSKHSKGLDPDYKEPHEFYVRDAHRILTLSLLDKHADSKGKLLGRTMVDLQKIGTESEEMVLPISPTDESCCLRVAVSVNKMFHDEESSGDDDDDDDEAAEMLFGDELGDEVDGTENRASVPKQASGISRLLSGVVGDTGKKKAPKYGGLLRIKVIKARKLKASDRGGVSDPFCYVEVDKKRMRTDTQLKTINPVWNKDMKFKVNDILSDIQFMIYDEDLKKSGSDMEFLGKVVVPMNQIVNGLEEWLALKTEDGMARAKGELLVRMSFEVKNVVHALKYCSVNPVENLTEKSKKFKLRQVKQSVDRLSVQIKGIVGCAMVISKILKWDYGFVTTIFAMVVYSFLCLYFALWMLPCALLLVFAINYFSANNHSSDTWKTYYRMTYVDDDDSDSDDEDSGDEGAVESKASGGKKTGFRARLDGYLEQARAAQQATGMVASLLERITNLCTWVVPAMTYVLVLLLAVVGIVMLIIPMNFFILAGGLFVFIDNGRARYNLKTKKVKTKKSSAKPLPIDILERVPDSIEIRQKRRLAPQAVSQMALEKARATVADAEA